MNPKISIITVTYNCEQVIRKTMDSVLGQTYPNIEYVIVDGQSKDATFDIVKEYEGQIAQAISEPDDGLYDAMNKGQQMATGDFVWFVNAGDIIHASNTIEKLVEFCESNTDVLYGEVMLVDKTGKKLGTRSDITTQKIPKNLNWKSLKYGMVVSHQGFLPRRTLLDPYISNNLAADIDWMINILKKSKKNTFVPLVLADFETGGISRQHHNQSLRNRYTILRKHYGVIANLLNHGVILLRAIAYKLIGRSKY